MVAALCLSAATPFAQRGKQQGRPADTQRPQQGALKVGDLAPDFTLAPRDGGVPAGVIPDIPSRSSSAPSPDRRSGPRSGP